MKIIKNLKIKLVTIKIKIQINHLIVTNHQIQMREMIKLNNPLILLNIILKIGMKLKIIKLNNLHLKNHRIIRIKK